MDASTDRAARRRVWIALCVGVVVLAAYIPALRAGWIWDDDSYVTANELVRSPGGLAGIWGLAPDPATGALVSNTPQYYPFVFTSFPAAVRHAEPAVRLAPPAERAPLEARLALYRRGERYVEPAPRRP